MIPAAVIHILLGNIESGRNNAENGNIGTHAPTFNLTAVLHGFMGPDTTAFRDRNHEIALPGGQPISIDGYTLRIDGATSTLDTSQVTSLSNSSVEANGLGCGDGASAGARKVWVPEGTAVYPSARSLEPFAIVKEQMQALEFTGSRLAYRRRVDARLHCPFGQAPGRAVVGVFPGGADPDDDVRACQPHRTI